MSPQKKDNCNCLIWSVLVILLGILAAFPALSAELLVEVSGIRSDIGKIRLAIFSSEDFLDFEKVMATAEAQAAPGSVTLKLPNLEPGAYSFSIVHDENLNGVADKNFFGVPTEGVASSNNAKGFMGPPSAEAATFLLPESGLKQDITIEYF